MRKAYTFVEILLVIVITPFIFLFFDGLFKTLVSEIPWSLRIANEHTTLLHMLSQMQKDIDRAKDLPLSYAGHIPNDRQVLIELPEGVFSYQLKDGQVLRRKLTDAGQSNAENPISWLLPHASVQWKVWVQNGRGYAVETNTHIEHKRRGEWKKKMAHSHLYFAGALGKELR
jgi:hypothetical protein